MRHFKTYLAWCLLLLILSTALFWFFPRYDDFGDLLDQLFCYFSAEIVAHQGPAFIPFGNLMRPGYLLNVPLVFLGGKFYSMTVLYSVFAVFSGYVFYSGWFGNRQDARPAWFFPMVLTLSLVTGAMTFTWILDYFTVPIIFLTYGLGFYGFSSSDKYQIKQQVLFALLSGLCLSIAVMGNMGMAPGVVLIGIFLAFIFFHTKTWVYLLSFLLSLSFFIWTYFFHWEILNRLHSQILVGVSGYSGTNYIVHAQLELLLIYGAVIAFVFIFLMFLRSSIFSFLTLDQGLKFFKILFWLAFLGLLLGDVSFVLIELYPPGVFIFMLLMSLILFFSTFCLINLQNKNKKFTAYIKPIGFACIFLGVVTLHQIISRGSYLFSLYQPLLFIALFCYWHQENLLNKKQNLLFFYGFLFFILLSFKNLLLPSYFYDSFWDRPYWIGQNNTYSEAWSMKIPEAEASVFSNYVKLYQLNHCDQKGLLAFDALFPMYALVHRNAPYSVSWLDSGLLYPESRYGTGEYLLSYLKNQKNGWCVAYKEHSGFYPLEKNLGRDQVFNYIIANKTKIYLLGHLSSGSQEKVYFLIKTY